MKLYIVFSHKMLSSTSGSQYTVQQIHAKQVGKLNKLNITLIKCNCNFLYFYKIVFHYFSFRILTKKNTATFFNENQFLFPILSIYLVLWSQNNLAFFLISLPMLLCGPLFMYGGVNSLYAIHTRLDVISSRRMQCFQWYLGCPYKTKRDLL